MNISIEKNNVSISPNRPSLSRLVSVIALAGFSLTAQAGKITSDFSDPFIADKQSGFGGLDFTNIDVVLNDFPNSTFDPLTGTYFFSVASDHTYAAHVFDDNAGTTTMGYVLAKDWPVGEPAGIKIVNDDFDVKEGKPTNCVMSTSYLADHYLDSADPIQVPCSGPFQSHKRYKLAMLPESIDTVGQEGIDLVFNVEADPDVDLDGDGVLDSPLPRDYQIFQKINNWTDSRLEGFTVKVGTGQGASFVEASDVTTGVGVANLSVSVPEAVWNAKQLANFSSGLFGPEDTKHGRPAGYFDPVDPAGFFIDEYPNLSGATDTLTATTTLGSDYADTPPGTALASATANQFGPWLPDNMLPYGIFFDDDNNPETDAELIAWYGYNKDLAPTPGLSWMKGAADGFATVPPATIDTHGQNLSYTMGLIDDLVNVGLNYVVTVGDISGFPGYNADPALNTATFTIRVTPTKDTSGTPAPAYVAGGLPVPALKYTSSDGVVQIDPNPEFNIGDLLTARVGDADLNLSPTIIDTVDVAISSTTGLSGTLTLIEQGEDRGVFAASLPEEYSDVAVGVAATVTVTYTDAFDDDIVTMDPVVKTATTSIGGIILPAGALQFNPASYTVAENDGSIAVTIERVDGSAGEVTVEYQTVSGTAIGSADYTPDTGTLTFSDTVTSQTLTIALVNDTVVEADESFTVLLSNVQGGANLGTADTATVTITDSDTATTATVYSGTTNDGLFSFSWMTIGLLAIGLVGRVLRKTS